MIAERDENYRLICAKRGTNWQVEVRAGGLVGSRKPKSRSAGSHRERQEQVRSG